MVKAREIVRQKIWIHHLKCKVADLWFKLRAKPPALEPKTSNPPS